jgi:hypothetical protein
LVSPAPQDFDGVGDGRRVGQREGPDDEQVVAVVALEPQDGLVGVDVELVGAVAALGDERCGVALAQPAAGRGDRREDVVAADARGRRALRAVELPDLEGVVALATVERRDRRVVVAREVVVAALAEDQEAPVDRGVVVDPLDGAVAAPPARRPATPRGAPRRTRAGWPSRR